MDDLSFKEFKASMYKLVKWTYIIGGTLLLVAFCYVVYNNMNKPIAGVLLFMGGVLALYFYYVKWFVIPETDPAWPPYKTVCPDYLTLIDPGNKNLKPARCVDLVGVSANGRLTKTDPSNLKSVIATNDPAKVFSIPLDEYGQIGNISNVCSDVQEKGLTWTTRCADM